MKSLVERWRMHEPKNLELGKRFFGHRMAADYNLPLQSGPELSLRALRNGAVEVRKHSEFSGAIIEIRQSDIPAIIAWLRENYEAPNG